MRPVFIYEMVGETHYSVIQKPPNLPHQRPAPTIANGLANAKSICVPFSD
jgi:hypothetical protein